MTTEDSSAGRASSCQQPAVSILSFKSRDAAAGSTADRQRIDDAGATAYDRVMNSVGFFLPPRRM